VIGAVVLHLLADFTRSLFGELPGINMIIYGGVLIVIVMFAPRGVLGLGQSVWRLWSPRPAAAPRIANPEEAPRG
jgi:branched-chain amino acid transport system permease protein